ESRVELSRVVSQIQEVFEPIETDEAIGRYREADSVADRAVLLPVIAATAQPNAAAAGVLDLVGEALCDPAVEVRMGAAIAARYLPSPALAPRIHPALAAAGDDHDVREALTAALAVSGAGLGPETGSGEPTEDGASRRRIVLLSESASGSFAQFAQGQGWHREGAARWTTPAGT